MSLPSPLPCQALLGHTDTVTCLTASSAYHILVSGSRDRTCIIWDLNKLSFVTQLRGHRAPVSALCINELTVGGVYTLRVMFVSPKPMDVTRVIQKLREFFILVKDTIVITFHIGFVINYNNVVVVLF
ncbi:unnamed protein product [Oncorhynchus mykiss]|uniref:Uncharacterized protein n=1 Tax=Oncorhynchus mykiss TaxID=8022 RepID=A0A060YTV3_ONCMY|nr:unnamed protein product [Oncorhynchus mykiss]